MSFSMTKIIVPAYLKDSKPHVLRGFVFNMKCFDANGSRGRWRRTGSGGLAF